MNNFHIRIEQILFFALCFVALFSFMANFLGKYQDTPVAGQALTSQKIETQITNIM
jgi:hypothetical protein